MRFTQVGRDLPWLNACPGALAVQHVGSRFTVTGEGPLLAHVASALVANGIAPLDLHVERATLEQAFLRISEMEAETK